MSTFGDVEVALMAYLDDLGYCVTSTPIDLREQLPVIRIRRIGGNDDRTNDYPRVSVQAFTLKTSVAPRASLALAELVRNRMRALPTAAGGVVVDHADTDSGPVEIPWPDQDISVHQSIYRVTTRSL